MFIHRTQDCAGFWAQKTHQGRLYWSCHECRALAPDSDPPTLASRAREEFERILREFRHLIGRTGQGQSPA